MAIITRSITNLTSVTLNIFVPGYGGQGPILLAPSATLDLLTVVTEDVLIDMQSNLTNMVNAGELSVAATFDTSTLEAGYNGGGGSGITQLTGDVTAGPGSGSQVATLATVNSDVGSFTNANITVDAKGLVTAASNGSGGSQVLPNFAQNATNSAGPTNNTNTYVVTGPIVSIAAQKTTNAIFFTLSSNYILTPNTVDNNMAIDLTILQDGTVNICPLGDILLFANYTSATTTPSEEIPASFSVIFVPGDTSVHTYQLAARVNASESGADGFIQIPASNERANILTAIELLS